MIYFVVRHSDGAIKIGTSIDVARRLVELSDQHGECELLAQDEGSYLQESDLHRRFRRARMFHDNHLTEWFRPTDDLMSHIASLSSTEVDRAQTSPYLGRAEERDMSDDESHPDSIPF